MPRSVDRRRLAFGASGLHGLVGRDRHPACRRCGDRRAGRRGGRRGGHPGGRPADRRVCLAFDRLGRCRSRHAYRHDECRGRPGCRNGVRHLGDLPVDHSRGHHDGRPCGRRAGRQSVRRDGRTDDRPDHDHQVGRHACGPDPCLCRLWHSGGHHRHHGHTGRLCCLHGHGQHGHHHDHLCGHPCGRLCGRSCDRPANLHGGHPACRLGGPPGDRLCGRHADHPWGRHGAHPCGRPSERLSRHPCDRH
mmetsp:Transcript_101845/g.292216  ORF Transcript_101845/g.292216 Transcript_101845/m.292216 type:complete len:248 (-) Transcript_101845:1673-2416(-)